VDVTNDLYTAMRDLVLVESEDPSPFIEHLQSSLAKMKKLMNGSFAEKQYNIPEFVIQDLDAGENPDKHAYKVCRDVQLYYDVSLKRSHLFHTLARQLSD